VKWVDIFEGIFPHFFHTYDAHYGFVYVILFAWLSMGFSWHHGHDIRKCENFRIFWNSFSGNI